MEPSLYSLFVLCSDRFTFEVKFLGTFSSELFALDGFKHEFVKELKGKVLGCWCRPEKACHGDILAYLADNL